MEPKDTIALAGIIATLVVASINLVYMIRNNRRAAFVNTVTASRLRWIDSLRDKVSLFIAITQRIARPATQLRDAQTVDGLFRERDTLTHQIILHLNPHDEVDQAIQHVVEQVVKLTFEGHCTPELDALLIDLLTTTQTYLKKEWNRVKREAKSGEQP